MNNSIIKLEISTKDFTDIGSKSKTLVQFSDVVGCPIFNAAKRRFKTLDISCGGFHLTVKCKRYALNKNGVCEYDMEAIRLELLDGNRQFVNLTPKSNKK